MVGTKSGSSLRAMRLPDISSLATVNEGYTGKSKCAAHDLPRSRLGSAPICCANRHGGVWLIRKMTSTSVLPNQQPASTRHGQRGNRRGDRAILSARATGATKTACRFCRASPRRRSTPSGPRRIRCVFTLRPQADHLCPVSGLVLSGQGPRSFFAGGVGGGSGKMAAPTSHYTP